MMVLAVCLLQLANGVKVPHPIDKDEGESFLHKESVWIRIGTSQNTEVQTR